jgi:HAL2 family 3'(2'),5'-bisphosphate nucleotidase
LSTHSFEREQAQAINAVARAARVTRSVGAKIDRGILEKRDKSPVTVADFASQAVICHALAQAFPDDPVVGEESASDFASDAGRLILDRVVSELHAELDGGESAVLTAIERGRSSSGTGRRWTLDPVDGTKGFLRGEQYAIALALLVDGQIEVAALACPNLQHPAGGGLGLVFSAVRGHGASMTALPPGSESAAAGTPAVPLRVSDERDPARFRVCESVEAGHSAHDDSARLLKALGAQGAPVRLDSQAKYGVVARGEAELYLRLPTRPDYREKIWDHAAGCLVVQEAGGTVTDVFGNPLDFTHGRELAQNRGVIVSHGPAHARLIELLGEAGIK